MSYPVGQGQAQAVRHIFATSHARYDFLNRLLSFRRDVGWRRFAVEKMAFGATNRMLDVATGTADLAIAAAARHPAIAVTGVDFAPPMLDVGRRKVKARGLEDRIALVAADALHLPFADASFDVSAVAFGLRNIPDRLAALREMRRVTAAGGQVMVLEMTFSPSPAFRGLYGFYLRRVLPGVAALFARDPEAYRYLSESIRKFPAPAELARLMEAAGLARVRFHALTFGAAYLHIGVVPTRRGAP
jgi:demethylmenaquinone methyltransferase/2-methoxy-6-polyprenyl-1,4-benzoquinol methylase